MIKLACNICHREVKDQPANAIAHFCERCMPFADEFIAEYAKIFAEANAVLQKRMESFRNDFIRNRIAKLEVVK